MAKTQVKDKRITKKCTSCKKRRVKPQHHSKCDKCWKLENNVDDIPHRNYKQHFRTIK